MGSAVARIVLFLALCAAIALAVVGGASAEEERLSPVLATINICDDGSNQVGARVSAPGDGSEQSIRARFSLQWYSEAQGAWLAVEGASASPWMEVGSSQVSSQQAGYTFQFDLPSDGRSKQVRAVTEVQWSIGATMVRSSSAVSQAGLPSDVGGSQATCSIS